MTELDSSERIARLEACEDVPVVLVVRDGGMDDIAFSRAEVRCGSDASGKRLWEVVLPPETCSRADSPEIGLGLSWCYLAAVGILEVEEVCANSPAADAGVHPGHKYLSTTGTPLLGKTDQQICFWFKNYPETPLTLLEQGGTLQSPAPLKAPLLDAAQRAECWSAIQSTLDRKDVRNTR